jgi:hypothetical protein
MNRFRSLWISLAAWAVVLWAFLPTSSYAAACRGDKRLDVPMQPKVTVQSAGKVHLTASGGSDKSGAVIPVGWRIYDASRKVLDYFPDSELGFAWQSMLAETNLEGLMPGASYTIELISRDICGNQGTAGRSTTMPQTVGEANAPVLSTPTLVSTGLQSGQFKDIQFSLTDDTGIQDVTVSINGTVISEYKYFDDVTFRWWCDPFPLDGVQSTLEGPNYYVYYPDTYKYQYALVEVVAVDLFGNRTVTSAFLYL